MNAALCLALSCVTLACAQPGLAQEGSDPPPAVSVPLAIDNAVSACTRFALREQRVAHNLVYGVFAVSVVRAVADCGCKSAMLTYTVAVPRADGPGPESVPRLTGRIAAPLTPGQAAVALPLWTEPRVTRFGSLHLGIGCAPPD
ncbi:DUF2195 family protein [uncultured Rhodospira sp.]|uniref:DUF2195 family protein n=1 Tax=uncultured Rhodospira sp. TaxID=1936189 RepID=UPI003458837A